MVFLGKWEEDILEQWIWGNPNNWTVTSETSVSREQAPVRLALCHQVDSWSPSLPPFHCFQMALSTICIMNPIKFVFPALPPPPHPQETLIIYVQLPTSHNSS